MSKMTGIKTLTALPEKRVFKTFGYAIKEDWNTGSRLHIVFEFSRLSKDGMDLVDYARQPNKVFLFKHDKTVYLAHSLMVHSIPSNNYLVGKLRVLNHIEACEKLEEL